VPNDREAEKLWDIPPLLKKSTQPTKFDQMVDSLMTDSIAQTINLKTYTEAAMQIQGSYFGAQFIRVGNTSDMGYPPLVILGINYYGIVLLNTATKQELAHWPLMSILGWSSTPVRVLMKVVPCRIYMCVVVYVYVISMLCCVYVYVICMCVVCMLYDCCVYCRIFPIGQAGS
jgi:hypothetical protein